MSGENSKCMLYDRCGVSLHLAVLEMIKEVKLRDFKSRGNNRVDERKLLQYA
jgi:hypothetical protein